MDGPPVLTRGASNESAGTFLLFVAIGERVDTTQATDLGWSGWIVPLARVVVPVATGRFASGRH